MKRTILVPLDGSVGSETGLCEAQALARTGDAVLRLLYVAPPVEARVEDGRVLAYADQEAARVRDGALRYLEALTASVVGIPVELAVRFGGPAEEIVAEALESGAEVIAMATHRRTGLRRFTEGSVAERVVRTAPIPVLLVSWGGEAADAAGHGHLAHQAFWCREKGREVEVEFEMEGFPGFRTAVDVRSCSVFEPPTAVDCERRCLDPTFRQKWEVPTLIAFKRGG